MPVSHTTKSSLSLWIALLAPILGLVIYLHVLDNPLIGSSLLLTTQNPQVTESNGLKAIWLAPTPGESAVAGATTYRPVLVQMLRLEWLLWGNSPSSFHSVNLILFVAAILMFLLFIGRLSDHQGLRLMAALTFALHPLASQSLMSVAGQGELLSLLATLTACWLLLRHRQGRLGLGRCTVLIALLGLIAAGASEMGLLLPAWLGALSMLTETAQPAPAVTPSRKGKKQQEATQTKTEAPSATARMFWIGAPLTVIWIGLLSLRWLALGGLGISGTPTDPGLPGNALAAGPVIMINYLQRLLYPAQPTLIYPTTTSGPLLPAALAWLLLLGLVAVTVWACRRWRLLGLGLVLLLTALAALSRWIPLPFFMSEGPLLFALPGFCLAIGVLLEGAIGWLRNRVPAGLGEKLAWLLLGVAWLAMGWQASGLARGKQWQSAETLWQAETNMHPTNPKPAIELLDVYVRQANQTEADRVATLARKLATSPADLDRISELEAALASVQNDQTRLRAIFNAELKSTRKSGRGHYSRLALLATEDNLKSETGALWRRELKEYPKSFEALYELADIELQQQHNAQAIELASQAIQAAAPEFRAKALARYGIILAETGHVEQSLEELRQAIQLDTTLYLPYVYMARIYTGRRDYASAEVIIASCFRNVNVESYVDLADLYTRVLENQNRTREALDWAFDVINRYPADTRLALFVARYQIQFGQYARAEQIYKRLGSTIKGEEASDALTGIGIIALKSGHAPDKAAQCWRQAIRMNPMNQEAKNLLAQVTAKNKQATPSQGALAPANGAPKPLAQAGATSATTPAAVATHAPASGGALQLSAASPTPPNVPAATPTPTATPGLTPTPTPAPTGQPVPAAAPAGEIQLPQ